MAVISSRSGLGQAVDLEVIVLEGRELHKPHQFSSSSYSFTLESNKETFSSNKVSQKGDRSPQWNESFIFSTRPGDVLFIDVVCKHNDPNEDHVLGVTTLELLKCKRNERQEFPLVHPRKDDLPIRGFISMMVKVAKPKKICECDECNTKRLQSIFYDASAIMDSVSPEQFETIDPAWTQLLTSLGTFASIAEKVAELDSRAKLAVSAMTFAFKIVLEQVHRDAKIEELIRIIDDLYRFFLESKPMEKIALFKDTLQRLLTQTAECAYFIATYRKLKHFVQRAVVNVVSNADSMISKFEVAFGELKIELILGTALQTAVVSFRILQKIESVENLLYLNNLPKLKAINWDSGKVCARGTRQNIIDDVVRWASASSPKETAQESRIYLLSGPQGCGKSAIAHTVAQAFHQQGRLGASVFLNGDAGEADSQRVCSSIAFELSGYDPTIRSQMADLLKADHSLAWADIGRQFPDLIVKATRNLLLIGPVLIVLDGLYEGLVPSEQHRLITALSLHCASLPPNFRILMTTRPHDSVMGTLEQAAHCHIHEIGFDDEGSMLDTSSYISQCLRSLFEKKPKLAEHYSAEELHDQFVTRAMGLHLWVSTINQALLSCGDGMEVSILSHVLSLRTPLSKEDTMDGLFRAIIGVIPYPNLAISTILGTFIKSTKPLSLSVLRQVAGDPFKDNECIVDIMRGLGCIIEKGRGREGTLLYGIHPSLEDFLTNDARCGDTGIVINPSLRNRSMAEACLDELNVSLKQNILCLDNVMTLNEEIHDLSERIEKHIPQSLHYACLHWVPPPKAIPGVTYLSEPTFEKLEKFLSSSLLHWFETMSFLGHIDLCKDILTSLIAWYERVKIPPGDVLHVLAVEGHKFVTTFSPIISKAAMQTYISALPLMLSDSMLFKVYRKTNLLNITDLDSNAESKWRSVDIPFDWSTEEHAESVFHSNQSQRLKFSDQSSYSHFGYVVAQASHLQGKISFLDARHGHEIRRSIHTDSIVFGVAFSPDGQQIATVAKKSISIWDLKTSKRIHNLETEITGNSFITYSANGKRVMVGEISGAMEIWEADTGNVVNGFLPHTNIEETWATVAISRDGKLVAMPDEVGIGIFDTDSRKKVGKHVALHLRKYPYEPQEFRFAWAEESRIMVTSSGYSKDCINVHHNYALGDKKDIVPLECPSFWPSKLMLSPDNAYTIVVLHGFVLKGKSADPEIRLWDTFTGDLLYKRSTQFSMTSIYFMPDGQEIILQGQVFDGPPARLVKSLPAHMMQDDHSADNNSRMIPSKIEYSRVTNDASLQYASMVDSNGWIWSTSRRRQMWIPYPGYKVHSNLSPGPSRHRSLEIRNPKSEEVVLRFVIELIPEAQ